MKIKISPSLPLFLLSIALSKDVTTMLIPIAAAFIHECGHLIAARGLNIPIKAMRLGIFGAAIDTDMLRCSYGKEIILSLCGPLANIISAFVVYFCFGVAHRHSVLFITASVFLAALNLLPAGSFDGGRIFSSFLYMHISPCYAARISEAVSFLVFLTLWTASVYFILKTGAYLSLFIFSWSLFVRLFIFSNKNSSV